MAPCAEDPIKCLVVGDSGVGKTGLIIRYLGGDLREEIPEMILEPVTVEAFVGPAVKEMTIYDTSCQAQYDRLRHLYYPETDVFLVCCSTLHTSTLESARSYWVPSLKKAVPGAKIILVGTKTDERGHVSERLDTVVEESSEDSSSEEVPSDSDSVDGIEEPFTYKTGLQTARDVNVHTYMECSSVTGKGIREVFSEIFMCIMDPVTGQRRQKKVTRDWSQTQSLQ